MWDYRFGGSDWDNFTCLEVTLDGGFILGGTSLSIDGDKTQLSFGGGDYWIVKIDSHGIMQWDKTFGGTGSDDLTVLKRTSDGGYILGGNSTSGIGGNKTQANWDTTGLKSDYWIVKVDSLGNKQWDADYGGTYLEYLENIQQTSEGGYILGGYSYSVISGNKTDSLRGGNGDVDYWIIKTDSIGNIIWDKDFGGANEDYFYSLEQTFDKGYLLGGYSLSGISGDKSQATWGNYDFWILKIDSTGTRLWDKDFGGAGNEKLYSLQQTNDRGFILGGYSTSGINGNKTQDLKGGNGDVDYWIVKIDSLGNIMWDKDFGGTDWEDAFGNILQTEDQGYLLCGTSYSDIGGDKTEANLGIEQIWIVKTDTLGNKQWDKTIFTTGHDELGIAMQTRDGCYGIGNFTQAGIGGYKTQPTWDTSIVNPSADYWIVKFCDTTTTRVSNINTNAIYIIPNPTTGKFTITGWNNNNQISKIEIEIFNLTGEKILIFQSQIQADISNLPSGIYFLKLIAGDKTWHTKIIKE